MESNDATTTVTEAAVTSDGAPVSAKSSERYYSRFSLGQRYLHGFLALTFLGLAMTGLTLRFSNTVWASTLARAVGGYGTVLFFHLFNAVVLTIAFLIHVANVVYRIIARKEYSLLWGPSSMVPNLKDLQDVIAQLKWFVFRGPKPKFGRYAYWEKVDYWGVFWGMAIIGFSGYAMWFAPFFGKFLPGWCLNVALLIHGEEAILAVGFIFTVHFFNTHLRPESFPMDLVIFTGRVTEEELKHRHPEEYRKLVETGGLEKLRVDPPPRWLKNFGWTVGTAAITIGLVFVTLMIVAFVRE
jgi:cytochrome b subunit of formate dehydrogenase